jgi:glycosyltransferase involved in cell wall biosynthesis
MGVTELKRVSVRRRYLTVIRAGLTIAHTRIDDPGIEALLVCCDGLGSFINFANPALPSLCLCFTPLRAVYDPEYRARHLSTNLAVRGLQLLVEGAYRRLDRRAWRRYAYVFCISEEVKRRVLSGGLCDEGRIEVAYPGIDASRRSFSRHREPYFFLPGRIMWTKNIQLGILAHRRFRSRDARGFGLKIAGMVDEKSRPYYRQLRELAGDDPLVEFIVDPSDAQMREHYRACHAVLVTAFNEDLGITPLEAGAHGKPVIAVNRGGPRETVVHEETGLLVEPDAAEMAGAMSRLVDDPPLATRLGAGNYERSARFTWDAFVERIDARLDRMGGTRGR